MRTYLLLALLVTGLSGCLEARHGTLAGDVADPDGGGPDAGTFRVRTGDLSLAGAVAVVDVTVAGRDGAAVARRVPWDAARPVDVVSPCDATDNAYTVSVTVVGVYEGAPAGLGEPGSAAPSGTRRFDVAGTATVTATCVAGAETEVLVAITVLRVTRQGFIELAMDVDAGDVRDALWDVEVTNSDGATLWQQRVSSAVLGDGSASWWFVGTCDAESTFDDNAYEVVFRGLYAEPQYTVQTQRDPRFGAPPPPDTLEVWPPPPVVRRFRCVGNEDVTRTEVAAIARVARAASGAPRAAFAGLTCEASWGCGDASGLLTFACSAPDETPPTLYLDDLVLSCPGSDPVVQRPDGGADGEVMSVGGVTTHTWRVRVPLDAVYAASGPCRLQTRGTAARHADDGVVDVALDGTVPRGAVYPLVTWSLPLEGAVCTPASLGIDGPITIDYTRADALVATRFARGSR